MSEGRVPLDTDHKGLGTRKTMTKGKKGQQDDILTFAPWLVVKMAKRYGPPLSTSTPDTGKRPKFPDRPIRRGERDRQTEEKRVQFSEDTAAKRTRVKHFNPRVSNLIREGPVWVQAFVLAQN
ncbi:hypothetical protein AAFF_G00289170 [Aldrovandia affinis]|uniref:Uncharacterized protein n=1 Tax=Aldrovandia affinis TaxID=143900 RepID=A0AAD7RA01_9TELE|nr:hypothetical protein AAFF_G00289170 [Aldrovandia affinis]